MVSSLTGFLYTFCSISVISERCKMGVKNLLKTVQPFSEKISILDLSGAKINTIQYKVQYYIDKGNVRSGCDGPKNYQNVYSLCPPKYQNDQLMNSFSGKLSGHYAPKNDQNDQLINYG